MSREAKAKSPLNPKAGSPGQKDRLHAATSIQSSVEPEDYPVAERKGQVAIVGKKQSAKDRD